MYERHSTPKADILSRYDDTAKPKHAIRRVPQCSEKCQGTDGLLIIAWLLRYSTNASPRLSGWTWLLGQPLSPHGSPRRTCRHGFGPSKRSELRIKAKVQRNPVRPILPRVPRMATFGSVIKRFETNAASLPSAVGVTR